MIDTDPLPIDLPEPPTTPPDPRTPCAAPSATATDRNGWAGRRICTHPDGHGHDGPHQWTWITTRQPDAHPPLDPTEVF